MVVDLRLTYVDELIEVRRSLHGGGRGAPKKFDGTRQGTSLNRSCIIMLSALLQSYVQEVFKSCAIETLPALREDHVWEAYWKQMKGWGNPSADNIKILFLKIGIPDVISGMSWQKCTQQNVAKKLNELNNIRNQIAHGADKLRLNDKDYSLTLAKVEAFQRFSSSFGERFYIHSLAKTKRDKPKKP
jgi:hypothetical protein